MYSSIFSTRLHQQQRFLPALDHRVDGERGRLAALVGAVELRAVEQRAAVVHRGLIGHLRRLARAGTDHLVLQAAGGGDDPGLLAVLGQEFGGGGLVGGAFAGTCLFDHGLDALAVFRLGSGLARQCVPQTLQHTLVLDVFAAERRSCAAGRRRRHRGCSWPATWLRRARGRCWRRVWRAGTGLSLPPAWACAGSEPTSRMVPTTRASPAAVLMSRGAFVAAQCLDFTKHLRCWLHFRGRSLAVRGRSCLDFASWSLRPAYYDLRWLRVHLRPPYSP